jgi:hypothetical protein
MGLGNAAGKGTGSMGLIRKSLYLGTGGVVAPNSRKQRMALKQLAALKGRSEAEIRRAGSRYDFAGFWNADDAGTDSVPSKPRRPIRATPRPTPDSYELHRKVWELYDRGIHRPAAIAINLSIETDDVRRYLSEGRAPGDESSS